MWLFDKNYRSKEEVACRKTKSTSFYKLRSLEKQSKDNLNRIFPQNRLNEVDSQKKFRLYSSKDDQHSLSILNFKKEDYELKKKVKK